MKAFSASFARFDISGLCLVAALAAACSLDISQLRSLADGASEHPGVPDVLTGTGGGGGIDGGGDAAVADALGAQPEVPVGGPGGGGGGIGGVGGKGGGMTISLGGTFVPLGGTTSSYGGTGTGGTSVGGTRTGGTGGGVGGIGGAGGTNPFSTGGSSKGGAVGGAGGTTIVSSGGVGIDGGGGGTTSTSTAPPPASGLQVYVTDPITGATGAISLKLRIDNKTSSSVDMSTVTLRYWYQDEGLGTALTFAGEYVSVGYSNQGTVTGKAVVVTPAATGADHYLELSFTGTLAAQGDKATNDQFNVRVIVHTANYTGAVDVTNDYSYAAAAGTDDKITLHDKSGKVIWGTAPG